MYRKGNIFCRFAVLLMASVVAFSCMNEKEQPVEGKPQLASVLLNVNTGDVASKATIDPTDQEKELNTLRIYAFTDGKRVGYYYQGNSNNKSMLVDISMVNVNATTGKQEVKFYIIANEASMVVEEDMPALNIFTTEEQLNSYRFIAMKENQGLPMFFRDTVMLNMNSYRTSDGLKILSRTLSFDLKRPVGKLSFMVAKKSSATPQVLIKSVTMLSRGTRRYNYLMPQTEDFLKGLSVGLNDRVLYSNVTDYEVTATEPDGHENLATIYPSEVPFGSEDWAIPNTDDSAVLHVRYSMGEGADVRNAYVYLPPIVRNEWIQVKCTFSGQGSITVKYTVKDWNLVLGSDEDGDGEEDYIVFDYPTHTYILPYLPTVANPNPDPDPVGGPAILPQMSVSNPFCGYFQILYPEGQKWSPTIMRVDGAGAEVSDFRINVYEIDRYGNQQDITHANQTYGLNSAADTYYKIEVTPLEGKNVGAKVHLGITAEIQGFGHAEYLLVNGTQSENFWPSAGGTDPNIVIVTQVEENQ